jgi:hypothetical protein
MKKLQTAILAASLASAISASASFTYSGSSLQSLTYSPDSGATASYVAGSPDYAYLYTPDAGLNGGGTLARVEDNAALGTLSSFSASFSLLNSSGGGGNPPYWVLWLDGSGGSNPNNIIDPILIVGAGGETMDGSSTIHVVDLSGAGLGTYWDDSLSSIYNVIDTSTGVELGNMQVLSARVEIGEWNIDDSISASAEIGSITVPAPVPEPTTMVAGALLLLPFGASTLRILRRKQTA